MSEPSWSGSQREGFAAAEEIVLLLAAPNHGALEVPVWVVVADDEVWVRSWLGARARWFRRALADPHQAVSLDDIDLPVLMQHVPDAPADAIDAAYRAKYAPFDYLADMLQPDAAAATVRLRPDEG